MVGSLLAAGVPVRAAIRPPGGSRFDGPPAGTSGVADVTPFDFGDPGTWRAAYDGVRVMFLVRPPAISRVKRDLLPAVEAARGYGVEHVVFLSLQGAERNRVVPHAAVESWLRGSGMGWTFVRPSFFTQNLSTTHAADVRDRDQVYVPAGAGRTAFVDVLDVADVAAAALAEPAAHHERAWTLTGPQALCYTEIADLLTEVLGRPIRYTDANLLGYVRHAHSVLGMPWTMAAVTAAIYTTARLGLAASLTDHVRQVLGRDPTPVVRTLVRERDAWVPEPRTGGPGTRTPDAGTCDGASP